jgi:hypothetical protein
MASTKCDSLVANGAGVGPVLGDWVCGTDSGDGERVRDDERVREGGGGRDFGSGDDERVRDDGGGRDFGSGDGERVRDDERVRDGERVRERERVCDDE